MMAQQNVLGLSGEELERLWAAWRTLVDDWYNRLGVVAGQKAIMAGGCEQTLLLRLLDDGCSVTVVGPTDLAVSYARELAARPGTAVRTVVSELTALPFEDNTFQFGVMPSTLRDLNHVEKAMIELTRVMADQGRLLLHDKTDLGHRPPSVEEELEALHREARQARGEDLAGIMTPSGYHEILSRAGLTIRAQRVWAPVAVITHPQSLNVSDICEAIAGIEDEVTGFRLSDRLNRVVAQAGGRRALAPRWLAIAIRDRVGSENDNTG